MGRFITLLLAILCSGCFLAPGNKELEHTSAPPPQRVYVDGGTRVLYSPQATSINLEIDEVCEVRRHNVVHKPTLVPPALWPGWATKGTDWTEGHRFLRDADHVHVISASATTVAGAMLTDLVAWAEVSVGAEYVAWADNLPPMEDHVDMDVDGSVDLAPFVRGDEITFAVLGRGRAPAQNTWFEGSVVLDVYHDCRFE